MDPDSYLCRLADLFDGVTVTTPTIGAIIAIVLAVILLYASGFVSASEIAFFSLSPGDLSEIEEGQTSSDRRISALLDDSEHLLATILISNNFVNVTIIMLCNYFFAFAATFPIILVCWWVTEHVTEPWCRKACPLDADIDASEDAMKPITPQENRSFAVASCVLIFLLVGLFAALIPENSLFRDPAGNIASFKAPVMQSIVAIIFLLCAIPGIVYGIMSGTFRSSKDFTHSMEEITHTLVQLIVFYFFAAQFMYAFGASNLGALIAIAGAEFLKSLALPPQITVFGIIVFVAILNLLITSASAKWSILAPIFVPMLMSVGIAPELTQVAFRISDSAVNVCTPIIYCQKYYKKTGVGTLSSLMLPYTIALLVTLTVLLYVFWFLGIPLGFQGAYIYPRPM